MFVTLVRPSEIIGIQIFIPFYNSRFDFLHIIEELVISFLAHPGVLCQLVTIDYPPTGTSASVVDPVATIVAFKAVNTYARLQRSALSSAACPGITDMVVPVRDRSATRRSQMPSAYCSATNSPPALSVVSNNNTGAFSFVIRYGLQPETVIRDSSD